MRLKKIVSLLLAVITVFSMMQVTAFAESSTPDDNLGGKSFTDVPVGSYYYNAAYWARSNGVTGGTNAAGTTFSPNRALTRIEIVVFLWKLANSPAQYEARAKAFPDMEKCTNQVYRQAAGWAVALGIAAGKTDANGVTYFCPDDVVTNGETMIFLYKAANNCTEIKSRVHPTKASGTLKLGTLPAWCKTECKWANSQGYLAGIPNYAANNTFNYKDTTTRAMAVYLLWEMMTGDYMNYSVKRLYNIADNEIKNPSSAYSTYYGGPSGNWCAAFASWCAYKAGLASSIMNDTATNYQVLRSKSCTSMMQYFNNKGHLFVSGSDYKAIFPKATKYTKNFMPRPGDFVFFAHSDRKIEHVGIVTEVKTLSNGKVQITVAEGNTNSNKLGFQDYTLGWNDDFGTTVTNYFSYIVGFGRVY